MYVCIINLSSSSKSFAPLYIFTYKMVLTRSQSSSALLSSPKKSNSPQIKSNQNKNPPTIYQYLTTEQLQNLRLYRYSGIDRSFLSNYVLCHFWNFLVTLFPLWMAPNLITLIGLMFMGSAVTLILSLGIEDIPSYAYFYCGLCVFIYANFDAVDGKQARRTGTSGPLGELFDHGCDAINLMLTIFIVWTVFGLDLSWTLLWLLLLSFAAFYGSTWEEYHTGTLYLGYFSGPVEGTWGLITAAMISGIYGNQVWQQVELVSGVRLRDVVVGIFGLGAIGTIIPNLMHSCDKKGKSVLIQLLPFSVFIGAAALLPVLNPQILKDSHVFCWYVFFSGVPVCTCVARLIVAHLTKSAVPGFIGAYIPMFLAVLASALKALYFGHPATSLVSAGLDWELLFMQVSVIGSVLAYAGFASAVIADFCAFLDINCLTIKKKQ